MAIIKDSDLQDNIHMGNKASTLVVLKKIGFKVPSFWVLPVDESFEASDLASLPEVLYAIRSSSPLEDGYESSFAGQFCTKLRVKKLDIVKAIDEVVFHARENNLGDVAVIIQKWIEPDYSGIAFSRDPLHKNIWTTIEYTKGSAEQNVGGEVVPDKFIASPKNLKKASRMEKKSYESVRKIEEFFGYPIDIEWATIGAEIYILQARPITTLGELNLKVYKDIEKIISHKKNYLFERGDVAQNLVHASEFNKDLSSLIFGVAGIVEGVYQSIGVDYQGGEFHIPMGSCMYMDKQVELQALLPSYGYKKQDISQQPKIANLKKLFKTIKNIFYFSKFSTYAEFPDDLRDRIEKHLTDDWQIDSLEELKELYRSVYGDIALAGIYTSIEDNKKVKCTSKQHRKIILENVQDWQGNTLDVLDDSKFAHERSLRVKDEFDTIMNFREYARWLSVKLATYTRNFLIDLGNKRGYQDPSIILYASFQEVEGSIEEKTLFVRKATFEENRNQKLPIYLSDLPQVLNSEITTLSPGIFEGEICSIEMSPNEALGKVLFTETLTPDLIKYFPYVKGVITQHGGILSHLAILAREKGVSVVQTNKQYTTGEVITWDGIALQKIEQL